MVPDDRLALLMLVAGVLLLATPAAIVSADYGAPTYEYEAVEFTFEDGEFVLEEGFFGAFRIDNIACTDRTLSRSCSLERYVYDQGRVAVDGSTIARSPYRYVNLDGSIYRTESVTEDGTTYLTHEEIDPDVAIRRSSTTYSVAPPEFRQAVDEGTSTSTVERPWPQLVTENAEEPDERFYYVRATSTPPGDVYGPGLGDRLLAYGLALGCFGAGLFLVVRGYRRRLREQWF